MGYLINKGDTFKVSIEVVGGKHPRGLIIPDPTIPKEKIKNEWAEFYRLTYGLSNKIRSESLTIEALSGLKTVDLVKYNENRLRHLLKDWSLADEDGKKIELKRTEDRLDDRSFQTILNIEPTIIESFLIKAVRIWDLGEEEEKNF